MSEEQNNSSNRLFRKSSLERFQVPEQIDMVFVPVRTYPWLIWSALGILGISFLFWLFFGSIPVIVQGRGIIVSGQGLYNIQANTLGLVEKLLVKQGDYVSKGQLVAKVQDPASVVKYQNAISRLEIIEKQLKELRQQVLLESHAEKVAILKGIESSNFAIQEINKTILELEAVLAKKEVLYQQQLIGLNDLQITKHVLSQYKVELEATKASLAKLEANLAKLYRDQEIKDKERELLQATQEKDILKLGLDYGNVYSPDRGVVLELLVNEGDRVSPGMGLMHLEYDTKKKYNHVFYGFIPIAMGKNIKPGFEVKIEPSTVNRSEYGALIGKVDEISLFAVSKEKIVNLIQNENLANYFMHEEKAVTQLVIVPVLDSNTPTGYKWTSEKGPPFQITTGTVCIITIVAERISPLFYFFSLWRLEKLKNEFDFFWKNE